MEKRGGGKRSRRPFPRMMTMMMPRGFASYRQSSFVDHVVLTVQAGNGGKGCVSHRIIGPGKRPDGGHGGDGGDVVFRAVDSLSSFSFDRRHYKAKHGSHGSSNLKNGKRAKTLFLDVPVGTVIKQRFDVDESFYSGDFDVEDLEWEQDEDEDVADGERGEEQEKRTRKRARRSKSKSKSKSKKSKARTR